MSCHNIGHALNNINEKILKFYQDGKLSREDTLDLMKDVRDSVGFCDGNLDEAVECLDNYCSVCLNKKEDLINYKNIPEDVKDLANEFVEKHAYRKVLGLSICRDCLTNIN